MIVCSESFKDIKRSQSAAKSNAPEGGPPAWRRGGGSDRCLIFLTFPNSVYLINSPQSSESDS